MSTLSTALWTLDQFLDWEARQEGRHEYLDGMITAMVGGTVRHQVIIANIAHTLRNRVSGGCHVFSEGLKVLTPTTVTYPDVVVRCDSLDLNADSLADADLIVEVLSPSTADFDLGRKWEGYQQLASLQAYLVVWQDRRAVQLYERMSDEWKAVTVTKGTLSLPFDIKITLDEIYQDTDTV